MTIADIQYPPKLRGIVSYEGTVEFSPFNPPFTGRGFYFIDFEEFSSLIELFSCRYGLSGKVVKRLSLDVVNKFCHLFYHQGVFDWEGYKQLWEAVCASHHFAVEQDSSVKSIGNHYEDGSWSLGAFTAYYHEKALHRALLTATGNFPEILKWYRLDMQCLSHPTLEGGVYENLQKRYLRSKSKDYYLALAVNCHHEGDFYVVLRERSNSFYPDTATCGFRIIPPVGIIENLQGKKASYWRQDITKIGWRWLMVKASEEVLKSWGITLVLFRPASQHWYRKEAGEDRLKKIMDETALQLGYQPISDGNGEILIFVKDLSGNPIEPGILESVNGKHLLALKPSESDYI